MGEPVGDSCSTLIFLKALSGSDSPLRSMIPAAAAAAAPAVASLAATAAAAAALWMKSGLKPWVACAALAIEWCGAAGGGGGGTCGGDGYLRFISPLLFRSIAWPNIGQATKTICNYDHILISNEINGIKS